MGEPRKQSLQILQNLFYVREVCVCGEELINYLDQEIGEEIHGKAYPTKASIKPRELQGPSPARPCSAAVSACSAGDIQLRFSGRDTFQ